MANGIIPFGQRHKRIIYFGEMPYGSFPRLVLAYIITRVIQTGARRVELEEHFGSFLKEIGYTGNLRGNTRASKVIHNQLLRLLRASITFEGRVGHVEKGQIAGMNMHVATKYGLWWDFKNPEQGSLWGSYIEISEEFRQAILSTPVPLRTDILKALKKSPLALDVYMWISYRLFTMHATGQESVSLGYGRLQEQFGTGIAEANYRQFRKEVKLAFAKVAQCWGAHGGEKQPLNYELDEGTHLKRDTFAVMDLTPQRVVVVATGVSPRYGGLLGIRVISGHSDHRPEKYAFSASLLA